MKAGSIYATPATSDLCNWMLRDTAHIEESDADFVNRRSAHRKSMGLENGPAVPLYTTQDAERTLQFYHPMHYHQP